MDKKINVTLSEQELRAITFIAHNALANGYSLWNGPSVLTDAIRKIDEAFDQAASR